ncbi:hypothetical protein ACFSL4_30470 [Streptomyces caeni]|uniref:Uncharacterized protein n=1 Tax=Streptomyces caeni TaxID=2307231 RepID=A0ABW4J0V5_9ACTN
MGAPGAIAGAGAGADAIAGAGAPVQVPVPVAGSWQLFQAEVRQQVGGKGDFGGDAVTGQRPVRRGSAVAEPAAWMAVSAAAAAARPAGAFPA